MASDAYIADRFQRIDAWKNSSYNTSSYYAGWPTFHQATYPNPTRTVYGHFLFKPGILTWQDVPATEYAATDLRTRFTGAHDYAVRQGFQHGFPNFHEANGRQGLVYGTYLVPPNTAAWHDVPVADLGLGTGDPTRHPMDEWFRGAADYAARNGYVAGMPNGHYALYSHGWVCGVMLFLSNSVDWLDIRGNELGLWDQPMQGMHEVGFTPKPNDPATWKGFTSLPVGIAPSFAVIDRIRNMAKTDPQVSAPDIPVKLSFVDVTGRPAGPADIAPGATVTGNFVGLSLAGDWTALPTGLNLPGSFSLEVYWTA